MILHVYTYYRHDITHCFSYMSALEAGCIWLMPPLKAGIWSHTVPQIWEKMLWKFKAKHGQTSWFESFLPCLDRWKLHVDTLLKGSHSKKHVDGDGWCSECSRQNANLVSSMICSNSWMKSKGTQTQRRGEFAGWVPFCHWVGVTLRELAKGIGTQDFSKISGFRRAYENTPNHISYIIATTHHIFHPKKSPKYLFLHVFVQIHS